jgi:hypothetical protein
MCRPGRSGVSGVCTRGLQPVACVSTTPDPANVRVPADGLGLATLTVPHGRAYLPNPADRESTARTATGRVLYATSETTDVALPGCWTAHQWRQLCERIRDADATVIDQQDAFPGTCCVSAPVWRPSGSCVGAVDRCPSGGHTALSSARVGGVRSTQHRVISGGDVEHAGSGAGGHFGIEVAAAVRCVGEAVADVLLCTRPPLITAMSGRMCGA